MAAALIYRSAVAYELAMLGLYGRHYRARSRAVADLIPPGASVLDLCCGPGTLYRRHLRAAGVSYTGLDLNPRFIARVRRLGAEGFVRDLRRIDELPRADCVVIQASLYHFLPDPAPLLSRMERAARHRVIVAEPIRNLAGSRNPLLAALARRQTDPGAGGWPLRFDEATLDRLLGGPPASPPPIAVVPDPGGAREGLRPRRRPRPGRGGGAMNRRDAAWLAALALLFLAWHVPIIDRTPAGQDEDWYGVTGITILRSGLPRTPYITSDDPRAACYRADVALYTLPPLSFYLQAAVHLVRGDGLGSARLASALEGLATAMLVYGLGRLWLDDRRAALLGASAYVVSRPFLFPATMARPDMAATLFGLAAVGLASLGGPDPRRRHVAASGAAAGLSLLAHPFGVVPAAEVGLWLLARPGIPPARRLRDALIFGGTALAVVGLWLPLIALHPDLFRAQFLGNVIRRAGPGAGRTLLEPLSVFAVQLRRFWGYAGPPQALLFLAGMAWGLFRSPATAGGHRFRYHLAASLVLLILFQGRHPTLGYFAYPAALASLAVGGLASALAGRVERLRPSPSARLRAVATGLALAALLTVLLPGAGLRTLLAHLRHRGDPAYDARPGPGRHGRHPPRRRDRRRARRTSSTSTSPAARPSTPSSSPTPASASTTSATGLSSTPSSARPASVSTGRGCPTSYRSSPTATPSTRSPRMPNSSGGTPPEARRHRLESGPAALHDRLRSRDDAPAKGGSDGSQRPPARGR